ncbi:RagB/SusD family nutrient uptake outer membrane protein [Panacibacter ginsenosidivorans]|uniref:RagB/SusD family nutrient uptake outer membrane protein n=1 Tax=Panacibacter ginsenosidivorans TaxID=1813871 RepID=A0A5B8VEE6_9BACT|nr:RagB/SusD family nutrient uptake outer membrane protein [Panacibacter ginsenosidivorans]QEC69403.1 RagB/SusD family nutrient uptake outer membrane protein [Panacibacter ginsenosidivorans]
MQKKLINILSVTALLFFFSCSKQLDTQPTQSIDETIALQTSKDVEVALVGAYSDLGASAFYGGNIFVCADLLGDYNELNWSGTYQGMTQIKNKDIPVDNGFVSDSWLAGYRAINDVNNVLSAIDVVTDDKKDKVQGEAKFIRGAVYFDLVRLFAKAWNDGDPGSNPGVPIVLTPTRDITAESQVARSSVAAVYQQAISDLQDAESLLPEENGFFATKIAAAAMLARVYLQQGDYTNAADAANRAITMAEENGYALASSYYDEFPYVSPPAPQSNSSEDIFAMQVTTSSGANDFQTYYSADGRGDITIEDAHFALYEPNDDRLSIFYSISGSSYAGKFENVYGNVRIIRLAEMYLIRAEANFRLGTSVGAAPVDDINTIRTRVLLDPLDEESLTLDAILHERKLELAFEGFTLHDAKRLEQNIGPYSWNDPKLIYPIPQREIRVNANLTQNEGYE